LRLIFDLGMITLLNQILAYINESNYRCKKLGLDPNNMPRFSETIIDDSFNQRQKEWSEIVPIVSLMVAKFLQSMRGTPILMAVSDSEGVVIALEGDPTIKQMIQQIGLREGIHFKEEVTGTNSINLALKYQIPIQVIGEQHFHRILHTSACYSVPFRRKGENKKILGTLSIMTSIENAHPYLLTMLSTVVDSLERELQLQKQNDQLNILNQMMLESVGYGIIITDELGVITQCNHFVKKLFTTSKKDLHGFSGEFLSQQIRLNIEKVIQDEELVENIEITNQNQPNATFLFDVYPIFHQDKRLLGTFCQIRDITQFKKSEEKLRQSEKLSIVGQLAAGVAHEVRNPLTTIRGFVQLLQDKYKDDHKHLQLIMSEIDRINLIISEFLILSKPHAANLQLKQVPVILENIIELINTQAALNHCEILFQHEDSLPLIYCDENQIKQVFINVLKNALEAMPYGGTIRVNAYRKQEKLVIQFVDIGDGISTSDLPNLGKPFFTTKSNGTGLGLMISKKIIENHQGTFMIDSIENIGTTVEITLPICV
jgi:two-component system, sporulation sensor kinase E